MTRGMRIAATVLLSTLAVYLVDLDRSVRQQFEGRKWALPAHVFAAPTELYAGAAIDSDRFEALLKDLKFRKDSELPAQGTYRRDGGTFRLKTREFSFPEGIEAARELELLFEAGQLISLSDPVQGKDLAIVRMEPVQIGSFYPMRKEDRILVRLDQVPSSLLQILLSIEDRRFYEHGGVSLRGIARALWNNARAGSVVQGGSTLTQQLVKNLFLRPERTWGRKLREAVMALLLEAHYSKDQILETYLNEIYLGQDGARAIHGIGLASRYYFGRPVEQLELHQMALLVGLVRAPVNYDPWRSPQRAIARRNVVLDSLAGVGAVSGEEAARARSEPLDIVGNPHQSINPHPAFLDLVRRELLKRYAAEDLTSEGLRIFTTLDVDAQRHLESAAAATLARLDRQTRQGSLETAAVFTRRETGDIVALIGSRDPESVGFNRALDAQRQIGSLYKPVIYLTALHHPDQYTPTTPLEDTAIRLNSGTGAAWIPKNYDGRQHGTVALHTALAQSYNLATVRLGLQLGVERTLETLRLLGVERDDIEALPSVLLGAAALTPLEVAQMYQTLATDGFQTRLAAIRSVTTADGAVLNRFGLSVKQAADPSAVYLVNTILQEAVAQGTGRGVYTYLPRDLNVAGKTGTSNDLRDSWFAGYSGDYLGVVWIGRDDNRSSQLSGAQGALRVWGATMQKIAQQPLTLIEPEVAGQPQGGHTGRRNRESTPPPSSVVESLF